MRTFNSTFENSSVIERSGFKLFCWVGKSWWKLFLYQASRTYIPAIQLNCQVEEGWSDGLVVSGGKKLPRKRQVKKTQQANFCNTPVSRSVTEILIYLLLYHNKFEIRRKEKSRVGAKLETISIYLKQKSQLHSEYCKQSRSGQEHTSHTLWRRIAVYNRRIVSSRNTWRCVDVRRVASWRRWRGWSPGNESRLRKREMIDKVTGKSKHGSIITIGQTCIVCNVKTSNFPFTGNLPRIDYRLSSWWYLNSYSLLDYRVG